MQDISGMQERVGRNGALFHALPIKASQDGQSDASGRKVDPPIYRGGDIVQRDQMSWSHLTVVVDDVNCDGDVEVEFNSRSASMSMTLDQIGGRLSVSGSGQRPVGGTVASQGTISVFPPGERVFARGNEMRFLRHVYLQIDGSRIKDFSSGNRAAEIEPRFMMLDARLDQFCRLLADECRSPEPNGPVYADGISSALLVCLSRLTQQDNDVLTKGGLAPWQLRKTKSYMLDHMAEPLSLKVLADLIESSTTHFCRAFKASTGRAPHQWLVEARIEKSKILLIEKERSISDISVQLGFCDQSHFTRTFSRCEGVSPLVWQRARMS